MAKVCGKCEFFVQMDGMFGGCGAGMREKFDHETFSSVPACDKFEPKDETECACPGCNGKLAQFGSRHPMAELMQELSEKMPGGGMMFMGEGLPPGMAPPLAKEKKEPWINPLVKNPEARKPPEKVIHLATWKSEKGK